MTPLPTAHAASRCVLFVLLALCTPLAAFAQVTSESEDNNTESRADGPIALGAAVTAQMATRSDVDWFRFDTTATRTIDISLSHAGGRDFDWALYGASGPALATGATRANPEAGRYANAPAGRYYVKATSYSGSGAYTLTVSLSGGGGSSGRPAKPSNLSSWLTGNAADSSRAPVNGPALLLMGGGVENDEAFSQRAFPVANGGDVVVLRTSGSDGYNDYLYTLVSGALKPDSVETLVLDTRAKADSDYADWVIRTAELVFIAGGDQSAYLNAWQGTRTQAAIKAAYARGAVIGGTSAGLAVQGEFIYDPDGVAAATSAEAIANPYRASMLFANGFLDSPLLADVITDSHFRERDRMGRLLAFMARLRQDGSTPRIRGIGIDESTSLFVAADGLAVADGEGAVYLLDERADTQRVQVTAGAPLVYRSLLRTKLTAGQAFHLLDGVTDGAQAVISVDGRNATPLSPANAY